MAYTIAILRRQRLAAETTQRTAQQLSIHTLALAAAAKVEREYEREARQEESED